MKTIFDIGCHTGEDTDFYLKKGFRVVAVEANPALCANLKVRFASWLREGKLTLVEAAIAENSGTIRFFINTKTSIWSTTRSELAFRSAESKSDIFPLDVASIRFADLIRQFGSPYYLKIDIEGSDHLCLDGLGETGARPAHLSTESEQFSLREMCASVNKLARLGYRSFQLVNQALVPQQVPPHPASEGDFIEHCFQLGSSGLFGRELPGRKVGRATVVSKFFNIYADNKLHGLGKRLGLTLERQGAWYDLHASR